MGRLKPPPIVLGVAIWAGLVGIVYEVWGRQAVVYLWGSTFYLFVAIGVLQLVRWLWNRRRKKSESNKSTKPDFTGKGG